MQALPPVYFGEGMAEPDAEGLVTLDVVRWALSAWHVRYVTVYGFASSEGSRNTRVALHRARFVADRLAADGVEVEVRAVVPELDQRKRETELGRAAFRRADVVPSSNEPGRFVPAASLPAAAQR
jgi:outer membrane protein OmpA-like peptidoglycan-associated protein